ncbi:endonuclease [Clostridium botulinum]|nr:endonuclease [Clostridium botulinum]
MERTKILENMVTLQLKLDFGDENITKDAVEKTVKKIGKSNDFNEEECRKVSQNIYSKMNISMEDGILIKGDSPFVEWYNLRRSDIDFKFWNRYRDYLLYRKGWNEKVVNVIDNVSNDILSMLGDPDSKESWKRRGLVIGDVQSGKTANFTAICNKAVDCGYKVIIILTGMLESLRIQTQDRQDTDLVGIESFGLLNENGKSLKFKGVGELDESIRVMTFTSTMNDFKSTIVNNIGLSLKSCSDTALFVVKKNKSILENLEKWLKLYNADKNGIIDNSVLIIDDECDNASVNTKTEEDPTTINKCIRNLLSCFTKQSYVAVTATPYANIFINPEMSEDTKEMYGQDLFPRDFIYCLSTPSNYIGAKDIFLKDGKYYNSLEKIDDAERILPLKHKNDYILHDIPKSLRESIYYFILITSIRDCKGQENEHASMLVNLSRFTNVQNQFATYIEQLIKELQRNINNFSKLEFLESNKNKFIKELYYVWNKFNLEDTSGYSWDKIRKNHLAKSLNRINVQVVNQSSVKKGLPYNLHPEGYRVIAVGGNSLARGITLEGLCTTYFYRNSQTYDTLMQMGRWFGYRSGFEDLFKIWMLDSAIDWYETICTATEELKALIERMNNNNLTPEVFGLKVREDPASLIVTARNKMKNTKAVEQYIDLSGRIVETIKVDNNENILNNNLKLVKSWTEKLMTNNTLNNSGNNIIYKNVNKEEILDLISNFNSAQSYLVYNQDAISEYISNSSNLSRWDVIIPQVKKKSKTLKLKVQNKIVDLKKEIRQLNVDDEPKFIKIYKENGRILTGNNLEIGLDEETLNYISELRENNPDIRITSNYYLHEGRNPLLYIHFIDSEKFKENIKINDDTFVALSLGFPVTNENEKTKVKVRYRLNLVAVKETFDFEEEDD